MRELQVVVDSFKESVTTAVDRCRTAQSIYHRKLIERNSLKNVEELKSLVETMDAVGSRGVLLSTTTTNTTKKTAAPPSFGRFRR